MFEVDEIQKLQKYVNKHNHNESEKYASGGICPSSCCGYLPQEDGSIIRVEVEERDSTPGPGQYNPVYPSFLKQTFQYMKPTKTRSREKPTPSSCDYTHQPKSTRLPHILHPTDPYPTDPPYMSGELPHPDWLYQEPVNPPKNRFPKFDFHAEHNTTSQLCSTSTRFSKFHFRTDNMTSQFYSSSNRTLFPDLQRVSKLPSPDRYNPMKGMGSVEKYEKSSSQFMSEFNRFPPSTTIAPSPDAYTLPEVFGTAQTTEFVEPNEKIEALSAMLKHRDYTPEPLQYSPEIIKTPDKINTPSPFFKSKVPRYQEPSFLTPPSTKYNISRKSDTFAMDIRARTVKPGDEWYETSIKDTPNCTSYNISRNLDRKGGYISNTGHNVYESKPDYPLAFRSVHSSLIKPSYNIHYQKVIKKSQSKMEKTKTSSKSKPIENDKEKRSNTAVSQDPNNNPQNLTDSPKK